jgi:hypothetical protein
MPTSAQITVGTTATLLVAATAFDQTVNVHNAQHGAGNPSVYLGDANVTTANGFELDADAYITVGVGDHEALYAICATGTVKVAILKQIN